MPLTPDAQAFLDRNRGMLQPFETTLEAFRRDPLVAEADLPPIYDVRNLSIAGGDGQPMALRVYRPAGDAPKPVCLWVHGGSFTRGTLDTFEAGRRLFATLCDCVVVAVDQRLSPEARFPKPIEDALAALIWAAAESRSIGGDPALIGVAGESSGASIAAALTLLARDRGGPAIAFQILLLPLVDARLAHPSMEAFGYDYLLTKAQLGWAYEQYAPGVPRDHPLLSPLIADLGGLPPAVVVTVEYDPVRDEGEAYAAALQHAGVDARCRRVEGVLHHYVGPEMEPTVVEMSNALLREVRARPKERHR